MYDYERLESAILSLPNKKAYIPVGLAFVRSFAKLMGFAKKNSLYIEMAVKEAMVNIIEYSYKKDEKAFFEIICHEGELGIEIHLRDKGMPIDPDLIPKYKPTIEFKDINIQDLRYYLINKMVDKVIYRNLGHEGKEIYLLSYKHSNSIINNLHSEKKDIQAVSNSQRAVNKEKIDLEYRLVKEEEVIGIAECVYESYGYSYSYEDIYIPERWRAKIKQGEVVSAVAVSPEGTIAGHLALIKQKNNPHIVEIGSAATRPQYRGRSILNNLTSFLKNKALEIGLEGIFAEEVTIHAYTQKTTKQEGFKTIGFYLAIAPKSFSFKNIAEQIPQRESVVLGFFHLEKPKSKNIYPPPQHCQIIKEIYANLEQEISIVEADPNKFELLPASHLEVEVNHQMKVAKIYVSQYGKDIIHLLHKHILELKKIEMEIFNLHLDLEHFFTAEFVAIAEKIGFVFTGVMPGCSQADQLIMQFFNGIVVDYEKIHVECPMAKKILYYIKKNDKLNINGCDF